MYYIYPFRVPQNADAIPVCSLKLPDGKYIAYQPYTFTYYEHKPKKLIVSDTNLISVVFEIRENLPQNEAFFYGEKRIRPGDKLKKLDQWCTKAAYEHGEKNGTWVRREHRDEITTTYQNSLKHGLEYSKNHRGYVVEGNYTNGSKTGRFYDYGWRGNIQKITYYDPENKTDTVMAFRKGKITVIHDVLRDNKRNANGIWYDLYNQKYSDPGYFYDRHYAYSDEIGKNFRFEKQI